MSTGTTNNNGGRTWLDRIEQAGNRLPHPATLFAAALVVIMLTSAIVADSGWSVQARPGVAPVQAVSLLDSSGLWWLISHLVSNFINFPPLAIVLVGMLGIGLAERSGLIETVLGGIARRLPGLLLTPATVLLGILSSVGLDAGYVVLPPIAAALYAAAGRPALVGIAASFAGISAGFSANLVITAVDPLLAGFTEAGAHVLAPDYKVAVTANWYFMIVSTVVLTAVGWAVSARFVEPRMAGQLDAGRLPAPAPGPDPGPALELSLIAIVAVVLLFIAATVVPGAPLNGKGERFDRWIEATVPFIFLVFAVPGLVFGVASGQFKSDRDIADALGDTMARLGPYIVLAFFAAQFIEAFKFSRLGEMLAISGGQVLVALGLPDWSLIAGFVLIVMAGNLFIGSASAKYAFFAPIFVPMFMYVGLSPELTQAAYRVGDSVTNVITPLNPYMVIIVALVQRLRPDAGLGTVVALMLPYSIAFGLVWTALLIGWIVVGAPLGPGGPLHFTAP